MTLVCHPRCHPLADYHQFTTRMIKSIYVFRSMDRVYLFSRLELTINWIAFSIELIYCTDKGAAYGKKLLKTVLISVRCRTRSLPFKLFKSLLEKKTKKTCTSMNNGSTDSEPSALTTGLNKNDSLNQLTTHVKSSTLCGRTVVHPNFFGLMGYYYFV